MMANGSITVVKKSSAVAHGAIRHYIGRGSALGNPCVMRDQSLSERQHVCFQYENYLRKAITDGNESILHQLSMMLDQVKKGHDIELACFCAPLQCHGDYIKSCIEYNL